LNTDQQKTPLIIAGIDAGIETTKAVVFKKEKDYEWSIVSAGTDSTACTAEIALYQALMKAELPIDSKRYIVATGIGGKHIPWANEERIESFCLSKGINFLFPTVRTLLDLGARKSLALRCEAGSMTKSAASNKCAAGTGTYLKMMMAILQIDMSEADKLYFQSNSDIEIQAPCAVFAESEIISRVHTGEKPGNILRGIYKGLAGRIYSQLLDVGIVEEIAVSGGLARSAALLSALRDLHDSKMVMPEVPEIVGALGAALFAFESQETLLC
jgi:predicted CoA-substrate-specific enzyme activase